ncbi:protein kinase [Stieleria sp. JC731]|uniref:bifunctional serine/threonine-protein kinase/formylglycine-generating enzyme family protein n=1 Tax=Pirellulaceae TaxID=2691357 RepID=UPI001E48B026|nr:bifunctional serine/threonine-protein kinase/formylglycine-generating enzyme family protein [Stieleria sp. JC731]MCC9599167.1 protein kinase [Stieleria sp. JC731]
MTGDEKAPADATDHHSGQPSGKELHRDSPSPDHSDVAKHSDVSKHSDLAKTREDLVASGGIRAAIDDGEPRTVDGSDDFETDELISDSEARTFLSSAPQIDRYRVEHRLASGGFGNVFLATDTQLKRRVAIKIPHQERMSKSFDVERFLEEARTIASLDHPGVVPIYDFGKLHDRYYIVSRFIDGQTLGQWIQEPHRGSQKVEILRDVAETLDFIHRAGVVHRDIKPANLLLDDQQRCFITDFGLALQTDMPTRRAGKIGTYAYMSPEQARGENHLIDRRSDLFSLGVVMYEVLCGTLPFSGDSPDQTLRMICNSQPESLRTHDRQIPKELERICLRLLSKRATSRYQSAATVAEDLAWVLQSDQSDESWTLQVARGTKSRRRDFPSSGERLSNSSDKLLDIVPRGLRAFDQQDADYFTKLLPGPYERDGLPESIAFWKSRIEPPNEAIPFRVGVIYGKSGSGKSSFIRAGLLPRLPNSVIVCFVSATSENTDQQILFSLRQQIPSLPNSLSVVEAIEWIRKAFNGGEFEGKKLLLVIDQFEQWLHAYAGKSNTPLALALRQCDGEHVQCILLVRDDFWIGVSCLADEVEIELTRSQNLAMIDLFDKRHARRVLAEYGCSFARLPDQMTSLSSDQSRFLDDAIEGLAVEGKIVPVQLATFAEIMKGRPWTTKSLQQIGGIDGVGIKFLDESFGETAPADRQVHMKAIKGILAAMLPETGSDIKGATKSEHELLELSGYRDDPRRFSELLKILDNDLHLITPSDSKLQTDGEVRQFQLTHDYLVPSIRGWLTRDLRSTLRGRIMLSLADRAEAWNAKKEKRQLPSWPEWLLTISFTKRSHWNEKQQRMMHVATKRHITQSMFACGLLSILCLIAFGWMNRSRSYALAEQLRTANADETANILDQLQSYRYWGLPRLKEMTLSHPVTTRAGVYLRLGILRLNDSNPTVVEQVVSAVPSLDRKSLVIALDELRRMPIDRSHIQQWWNFALDRQKEPYETINAIIALTAFSEKESLWDEHKASFAETLLEHLRFHPDEQSLIVNQVSLHGQDLFDPLHQIYVQNGETPLGLQARSLLLTIWANDVDRMIDVYLDSNFETMLPAAHRLDEFEETASIPKLHSTIHDEHISIDSRQANAAAYLFHKQNFETLLRLLGHSSNPNGRSQIIERTALLNTSPGYIDKLFASSKDPSIEAALLLLLGSLDTERLSESELEQAIDRCRKQFVSSKSPEVHSAAWWALRKLDGKSNWLHEQVAELAGKKAPLDQKWSINQHKQTFIRFDWPGLSLDVGACEVTKADFAAFNREHPTGKSDNTQYHRRLPDDHCPAILIDWYAATKYCRWLTEQEGLDEDDQCYPASEEELDSIGIYPDYKNRRGYRLLFPDEWTRCCFGDATTTFGWGDDAELLKVYGSIPNQYQIQTPVDSMKPLPTGMFGMYGGVREWCISRGHRNDQQPIRGGDIDDSVQDRIRLSRSGADSKKLHYFSVGFRICRASDFQP